MIKLTGRLRELLKFQRVEDATIEQIEEFFNDEFNKGQELEQQKAKEVATPEKKINFRELAKEARLIK